MSICLVCDSSIVATYPSVTAARFAFRLSFIRFVLLFVVVLSGEPKQKQGRGYVDRKLVQAPSNFFAGSLLFWFFGDFRYGALLFLIVYTLTEIFYFDLQMVRIITVFCALSFLHVPQLPVHVRLLRISDPKPINVVDDGKQ